jgi:Zn-dependent membrane protease YugP
MPMPLFNFQLLLFLAPAILLGIIAQIMVRSAYAQTQRLAASMTGFAAARRMLDAAGLNSVDIEQIPGTLSDHYDPSHKVLRLSTDVFHGRSIASVGIAAHEAGHALQDAQRYAPLVIRNAAVPLASFGSSAGMILIMLGAAMAASFVLWAGIILFAGVVFFQLVNLPVEFNASSRAKEQLVQLGIIDQNELPYVRKVLNAAALTYVAATLQSLLTLIYYVLAFTGRRDE